MESRVTCASTCERSEQRQNKISYRSLMRIYFVFLKVINELASQSLARLSGVDYYSNENSV
ncbi:hypothetical protein Aeh1fORF01c [Aeromonas phage Aeh1]|uniref:Uncharacterized protein n=1 Tax=Aeromonas phage Aeh1 TaxID=2880362 RepID=Q76Z32_9CAUD|nr:hypothetical protein Aeh1p059 [Aeromonas phage Aeh1]AAQ17714.1 hypothetical protein Aeh1fORF01c [Aeromonas phage Aeh1]